VLDPERLDEIADVAEVKTTKRELEIAEQLVESLAGGFEPDKYRDSYREQVLAMIERKAQGKKIAVQPEPEELSEPAPDLMGALKASLEAVRAREAEDSGAGPGKPAKAKAAKKKATAKAAAKKPAAKKSAGKPAGKRATAKR
jgi:DNA end-binding protein Ku